MFIEVSLRVVTFTPTLFARDCRFNPKSVCCLFVLRLEPDSDGGQIIESVGVGRKRTLQS